MECSFDEMLRNIREEKRRHVKNGSSDKSRTLVEQNMPTKATAFQVINMFGYNVAMHLADILEDWVNGIEPMAGNEMIIQADKTPERSTIQMMPESRTDEFISTFGEGAVLYFLVSPASSTEFKIEVTNSQVSPDVVYKETFNGETPAPRIASMMFDYLKAWTAEKVVETLEQ